MTDDNNTPETSVSPSAVEEPKQTRAKSAGAKPVARKIAHNAVIGAGDTDPVLYSKAVKPGRSQNQKSLTVLHIQRRLADEGFAEAASAPGGKYEELTILAIEKYQDSLGEAVTGTLTRDQFVELFRDDPNVTVTLDTHFDHA